MDGSSLSSTGEMEAGAEAKDGLLVVGSINADVWLDTRTTAATQPHSTQPQHTAHSTQHTAHSTQHTAHSTQHSAVI